MEQEHTDNKNAYFNLSLCYSKLNKPDQSVESAERALSLDKNYTKCYFRLAHEYQKIQGKDYQVFINAVNFQKHASLEQSAEKE